MTVCKNCSEKNQCIMCHFQDVLQAEDDLKDVLDTVDADPLYEAFCELTAPGMYRPARSQEYFESLKGSEAETLYSELTHENYRQALDLVLNYEAEDVG
jgi:ribosome maturation factor RimP